MLASADELNLTYAQRSPNTIYGADAKFENGDYFNSGPTRRRHVHVTQINYIGKEANRWEEQFFVGMDEDAAMEYGADPNAATLFDELTNAVGKFGKQQVASHIGISRNSLMKILDMGCQNLSPRISQRVGGHHIKFAFSRRAKSQFEIARIDEGRSRQKRTVGIRQAIADRCVEPC